MATTPAEEREVSRKRISQFFFGSDNETWQVIVGHYNGLNVQLKKGYPWERAAASDTLGYMDLQDEGIVLAEEQQLELEKLE